MDKMKRKHQLRNYNHFSVNIFEKIFYLIFPKISNWLKYLALNILVFNTCTVVAIVLSPHSSYSKTLLAAADSKDSKTAKDNSKKETKGLLPELEIKNANESENQKKALASEILISKTENRAIEVLQNILKKKKGAPDEPDLWNRLAELYMRRSKSGRFFDLNRDDHKILSTVPAEIKEQSALINIKKAIEIYTKIEKEFPKYSDLDSVIFNNAFANQQIQQKKPAEILYRKMINQFSDSILIADANLALGELLYEQGRFEEALTSFKEVEKFPGSRVYSYGLYKGAWTYYNLRQNQPAIDKLIQVIKLFPVDENNKEEKKSQHNLRTEALRDLVLFYGETQPAQLAVSFFKKITTTEELGESIINLGKLYDSHGRQKEMSLFLDEYIDDYPKSPFRIKAHLQLIEAYETLKKRDQVIKELERTAEVCLEDSKWSQANKNDYKENCKVEFNRTNIDIAKKWWEIWLKNKQHKEFSNLTLQAFRILLKRDDPKSPDLNSRFAFSELLFQLEEYKEAAENYEIVGQKSTDPTQKHDSEYASIVSYEKYTEKLNQKTLKKEDMENLIRLGLIYLKDQPNGNYSDVIGFKVASLYYQINNKEEAEKRLIVLTENLKQLDLKRKSQDLLLDIYNQKKDFQSLKKYSKSWISNEKDNDRKKALHKIEQEAGFAEIQVLADSGKNEEEQKQNKLKSAEQWKNYFYEHSTETDNNDKTKNSTAVTAVPLAKEALWLSLSQFYALNYSLQAADLSVVYQQKYPDDPRGIEALKTAADIYSQAGLLKKSAQLFESLSSLDKKKSLEYSDIASELYATDGDKNSAQEIFKRLISDKSIKDQSRIYAKLLTSMKGQESSPEFKKIEEKILANNIEPYASEIKIKKVEDLLSKQKYTDAFNQSKSFVAESSGAPDDVRAKARMIQAQVLEKEFIESKTKTSVEKLSLVLSIKTEKLDKAQTAYLSSAKIAKNENIKLKALEGLVRIYTHYVDSVNGTQIKEELSEADLKALKSELKKLTEPIEDKKKDIEQKLKDLTKERKLISNVDVDYESLPVTSSVSPKIPSLGSDYFPILVPKPKNVTTLLKENKEFIGLIEKANKLVETQKWDLLENLAMELHKIEFQNSIGLFYLSIVAEKKNLIEKSMLLLELALKKKIQSPIIKYQKARTHLLLKDAVTANPMLLSLFEEKNLEAIQDLEGLHVLQASLQFQENNCTEFLKNIKNLDTDHWPQFKILQSECLSQKGDFEKSIDLLDKKNKNIEAVLQLARIQEIYRFDWTKAQSLYSQALNQSSDQIQKDWLSRKIEYLKKSDSKKPAEKTK